MLGKSKLHRPVCIGDDGPELVQRVVEVVHAPALAGVDVEPHHLLPARRLAAGALLGGKQVMTYLFRSTVCVSLRIRNCKPKIAK